MLPVTHGKVYTRLQVLLYTLILFGVSLLPYAVRMSGRAVPRGCGRAGPGYIGYAVRIYVDYSDRLARQLLSLLDRVSRRAVRGAAR
jgi:protoheme IX farnesyltransferase